MWRRAVGVCVALLSVTVGTASAQVHETPLPRPTGSHEVGTRTMVLTDSARGEPATADPTDHRQLVVEVWYPARDTVPTRNVYMDTSTARTWVERFGFPEGFQRRVTTHSWKNADPAPGRHPVLIFSHGLSWPVLMYQSYLEDLASHGYIVVGVNHTYGSDMVVFPDGRRATFDFFPDSLEGKFARDSVLAAKVDEWVDDLRFVATELRRLAGSEEPWAKTMDLDHLGVFGHSYGGSAAALVLERDPRFKAGLAMEGEVRDSTMRPLTMPRPFMHIVGGFNRAELAGSQYRAGRAPYYEVIVEGMWHAMFSDLILLYSKLGADAAWRARHHDEMTPERGLAVTRDYIRAFFDRWLRGQDSPFLHPWWPPDPSSEPTSPYPEARLRIDYGLAAGGTGEGDSR